MKKYGHSVEALFPFVIFVLFAALSMLLVYIGSDIYSSILVRADRNAEIRTTLSYVANKVRTHDVEDAIAVRVVNGTEILVLTEEVDGVEYENLIYWYDGMVCETFVKAENEFELSYGETLVEAAEFQATLDEEEGTLKVSLGTLNGDRQVLEMTLRSGK